MVKNKKGEKKTTTKKKDRFVEAWKVSKKIDQEKVIKGGKTLLAGIDKYKAADKKEKPDEARLRNLVADILGVSPFGITVLKGTPYINKIGRKQKLEDYGKGKERVVYKWEKMAQTDDDKAICFAQIVDDKGKPKTDWIIGECSTATMSMSTLKGYQNHMAQTRAHNRAIEELYGLRIHKEMLAKIATMKKQGKDVPDEVVTTTSSDEIVLEKDEKPKKVAPGASMMDGEVVYTCSETDEVISKDEYDYSMKMYGKPLSREAQKNAKPIKR